MFEVLYETLLNKVKSGTKCVVLTYLDFIDNKSGTIGEKLLLTEDEIEKKIYPFRDFIYDDAKSSISTGKIKITNIDEKKCVLIEPFIPKPRLIVFGGGHISKPVTEFSSKVGFSVTVIDDRPSFANKARFPEADRVICESFEKSIELLDLKDSDYVVIVTRGHKQDGIVLRQVLKYELNYVGMIGSKRRVKAMMDELLHEGYSKEKLDSVNSPIGIDIKAITPEEIAISIVGQLIEYKNKIAINASGEKFILPSFDENLIKKISEISSIPRAIMTILSTKGSVPRKAGAKMLYYSDGTAYGTIGGGCSEAGVKMKAREIMGESSFVVEHVDLTGDIVQSEGMACGGTMEVLIETYKK